MSDDMTPPRPRTYEEFWPYFMQCHSDSLTQALHVIATIWGLACMLIAFPLTLNGAWLILAPSVAYPIAWFSHLVVEGNKPAAWNNPYWSFLGDLDMSALFLTGSLRADVECLRIGISYRFTRLRRLVHHATELAVLAYAVAVVVLQWQGRLWIGMPFQR